MAILQLIPVPWGYGMSADEIAGKAVRATNALARGDVNGAARQAVGAHRFPIARGSNVYASVNRIGVQQPVPLNANHQYVNVATTYNASVNPVQPANVAHNVRVNANNPLFSNTTTIRMPTFSNED